MRLPRFAVACTAVFALACVRPIQAADTTPTVVSVPISDVTVPVNSPPTRIRLNKTFALQGVTGKVVRFTTSVGNIDVELNTAATPRTAANFLSYVAKGDATNGGYNNTLIQRSEPGFVVQGGGLYLTYDQTQMGYVPKHIAETASVASEAGLPNIAGTIAMALSTGPNSATTDWYFNLANNSGLDDASDGGPFTVFGRIIEGGLDVLNALAALPDYDLSMGLGSSFKNVPLRDYDPKSNSGPTINNLIYTQSIAVIPLTPKATGGPALLKLKVRNSNPSLLTATLVGRRVTLTYLPNQRGTATITVQARDTGGPRVRTSFQVTVQ